MALSKTGKKLAEASFMLKAAKINRNWGAEVEEAERKHSSNLNSASLPAELIRLSIRRMEDLAGAWVDSFLESALAEKALLSPRDIESIFNQLEAMTETGANSAIDSIRSHSLARGREPHFVFNADLGRARGSILAINRKRLETHRLRNAVIADMVDLRRQNARKQSGDSVPRIASDNAARGLDVSGPLATAQYQNWLTAVEEVVQEFLRAEETEPLNLERISIEFWLSEANLDAQKLLDAEFDWLGSQISTLLAGGLSALDGLPGHFASQVKEDRNRLGSEVDMRLRILSNRKRRVQGDEAGSSALPSSVWPAVAAPPGPTDQADGLPMLFKKNLLEADLNTAVAFALDRRLARGTPSLVPVAPRTSSPGPR